MNDGTHPSGKLLGALALITGMFAAYFVRSVLDDAGVGRLEVWYVATWGVSIIAFDLAVRALWGRGESPRRYLLGRAGPHIAFIAAWMWGLALTVFALLVLGPSD